MHELKTLFRVMVIIFLMGFPVFAESMINNIDLEESGTGTWETQEENNRYVLELYKDGYQVGDRHFTYGKKFDFSPLMQEEGDYHFEIGIYDMGYQELGMKQSTGAHIDRNTANENSSKYKIRYDGDVPLGLGWNKTDSKWSYRCKDGAFLQNDYLYLNDATFYFDTDGVMVTDIWINADGTPMYFDPYGQYDKKRKN